MNDYRGRTAALWLMSIISLLRVVQSVNSIANARHIAMTADGIPLDRYSAAASATIVSLFALNALSRLVITAICVIVLIRYRALIPLMFAVLLVHLIAAMVVSRYLPFESVGKPAGVYIGVVYLALIAAGLFLSLWRRKGE